MVFLVSEGKLLIFFGPVENEKSYYFGKPPYVIFKRRHLQVMQNLMSHIFPPIAGCSKSCEAAQYWSSGFTVLQASIDAAIIQVNMIKKEKESQTLF